jgi:pimeloyl-ACP methyl ester carboxylesterase
MRGPVSILALLAVATASAQPLPFGRLVGVGGHRAHLHCEGKGPVTVLLLHGTPRFSFHFALVQPKVAEFARACVYDRAGDAWSDPVPGQPSARIVVEELDRVMRHLSPRGPVVLAGHSVGGVLARAYYAQHPERVSAMVLIDTAPLQGGMIRVNGAAPKALVDLTVEELRSYAAEAVKKPRPPAPKATLAAPFDKLPARFHDAHLWATDKWQAYAAGVDIFQALEYQADLYRLAAKAATGTLPVWFLSRAEKAEGPEPWVEVQSKMASAWAKGKLVRVAPSGHDIQLDRPEAVVTAIREAVQSARAHAK